MIRRNFQKILKLELSQDCLAERCFTFNVDQALNAFTLGNAYVSSDEGIKGSLKEGKLGDVVVWEADLRWVQQEEIKDIPVAITIVCRRVVYEWNLRGFLVF